MVSTRLLMAFLLTVSAPCAAVARPSSVDPHVALRARVGLPAASAVGEVRLHEMTVYLPSELSAVARRDARGRWIVSEVRAGVGVSNRDRIQARTYRLSRRSATALEALLDGPGLYEIRADDGGVCLDPWTTHVEVAWKGRAADLRAECDSDRRLTALSELLVR